jgi:cytochrome c nitrite reductase small subunit
MTRRWVVVLIVLLALVVLGGVGAVALWRYHEQPQFCVTCHIMDPYLASWQSGDLGAHEHEQADVTCLDCHEPTIQQQVHEVVSYATGDYTTPLPELKYPTQDCFQCHEHSSYAQIIEMTAGLVQTYGANPHNSHFGEMDCRLCHHMHEKSVDYCAQCHSYGWQVP